MYHPFQILADLMTIQEKFGRDLRGKTINVSWAYASSYQKPLIVPQSLILLMTRFGMNVRLTHPPEYKLMPDIVRAGARTTPRKSGGSFEISTISTPGFKDADIVYPKSLGLLADHRGQGRIAQIGKKYTDWITDERRMATGERTRHLHALPARRPQHRSDRRRDRRAAERRL